MIWKEAVVTWANLLGGTEENHEELLRIVYLRAKILTRDLPNIKQECYPLGRDVR
jgi:hypothetical protein